MESQIIQIIHGWLYNLTSAQWVEMKCCVTAGGSDVPLKQDGAVLSLSLDPLL